MHATMSTTAQTRTLRIVGELDLAGREDVVTAGLAALWPPHPLKIDLSGVTFIDATGLGALLQLRREAAEAGCAVTVVRPSPVALRLLELTGTASVLTYAPGVLAW